MMHNPSLKHRKTGTRSFSERSHTQEQSSLIRNRRKNKVLIPAWTWIIIGIILLGGFIYVDHITHQSIERKSILDAKFRPQFRKTRANNFPDSNGTGKGSSDAIDPSELSPQAHAMNRMKLSIYEDPSLVANDRRKYHLIFSTDCSEFQHWQSYLLFHSALKVKQPGTITRIASGCSDNESKAARDWHDSHIKSIMGENFILHLTPHFSGVKDSEGNTVGDYKFFNKPFGLKHWLEHGIGFETSGDETHLNNEDDVVILIDPDMILLRPITGDFSNDRNVVIGERHKKNRKLTVQHGAPFAQKYGFGAQWRNLNIHEIAGADSPAKLVNQQDGGTFYPVGPPYLATVRDMYAIAKRWTEFVPKVHKEYPHLLAEMFAFCIAAAHLELPHQIIDSLMVSNVGVGGEGWPMVDNFPKENLCELARNVDHKKYAVPSVIHFCQRYTVGNWFFSKRKMKKDFFTCESPLMEEPPNNIVAKSDFKLPPGGEKKELNTKMSKREGFMVCGILGALNDAGRFFKDNSCNGEGNTSNVLNLNQV